MPLRYTGINWYPLKINTGSQRTAPLLKSKALVYGEKAKKSHLDNQPVMVSIYFSSRDCAMAIFKNRKEYSGYETKRIWTFVQSDCQSEEEFYVHQTWMDEDETEFASICKSKCKN